MPASYENAKAEKNRELCHARKLHLGLVYAPRVCIVEFKIKLAIQEEDLSHPSLADTNRLIAKMTIEFGNRNDRYNLRLGIAFTN